MSWLILGSSITAVPVGAGLARDKVAADTRSIVFSLIAGKPSSHTRVPCKTRVSYKKCDDCEG